MSKICIVGASNIKHISLISLYTNFFDKNGIPYDIIYMDRYGIDESTTAQNQYKYTFCNINFKKAKLKAFLGFRKFSKNKIKENNYSLIITWQTTSAYLLCDFLLRRYKGKYVINVRDYVAENNRFIRPVLNKLVKHAAMTAISSDGFRSFLPEDGNYTLVNSINDDVLRECHPINTEFSTPYVIGFAGNCRYFAESYKLINALKNDKRFALWYCGTNSDILSTYAAENGINNVYTRPAFSPNETVGIFSGFNLVNSAFGNDAIDNSTLMPIRLYTSIAMHLPVLANEKTHLGKEIEKHSLGFVIKDYDGLANALANYFECINRDKFYLDCDAYIEKARKENETFFGVLRKLTEVN